MELLQEYLQQFTYLGLFGLLALGGIGISVSEEAVLFLGGVLLYASDVNMAGILVAGYLGVVTADSITYWIGRGFGARILATRLARLAFHPKRLRRVRRWFNRYGTWAVFFARFMVGLRAAAIFSAGAQRFSYARFLLADLTAGAIQVPVIIAAGYYFSRALWEPERGARLMTLVLTGAAVGAAIAYLMYRYHKRRRLQRGV